MAIAGRDTWIRESTALDASGVGRSTLQNWIRAQLFDDDLGPAWTRRQVLEVRLLRELRDHLQLDDLAWRWPMLRGDGTVASILARAEKVTEGDALELVLRTVEAQVTAVTTDGELARAVRGNGHEPLIVLEVGPAMAQVNRIFDAWEQPGPPPTERRPGRPAARRATTNGATS
jgi:hypothetical protein